MALESGLTRILADQVALARATTNTQKMKSAMKTMWDTRSKLKADDGGAAFEMVIRAQIDEVFLVLAHLGEAIIPLGVFNKDYYLQTLGDVQAAIASCGHELLPLAWSELDSELQYVCTAGLAFCACYAPMPLYRGFGACVLSDYDWGCPDMSYLEEKAKKKALRTIYGIKQRVDPQATRSVFVAFDQAVQLLQVKPMAFLEKRPVISGFADHQPCFGAKPKKEVRDNLDLLEDWVKQLEKRGHPPPKTSRLTSWGIPFATWTSPYSCQIMKTAKDCELLACRQMDPGRLLHAFVCRASANLDEGQVLVLLPGSPAESLLCWLEGLPGTSHKIVKWQDLETQHFETKIPKSLRKRIGHHPLPGQYAIRDPNASTKLSLPMSSPSRTALETPNTVSPPPYSASRTQSQTGPASPPAVELGLPEPRELAASPITHPRPLHTMASRDGLGVSTGTKSLHTLRRKPLTGPSASTSSTVPAAAQELDSSPKPTQVPVNSLAASSSVSSMPAAVELPTDFHSSAPARLVISHSKSDLEKPELPCQHVAASALTQEPESVELPASNEVVLQPIPTASEQTSSRQATEANTTSRKDTGSSDHYLELLNKVASGEISPQALSEMLRRDQEKPETTSDRLAQVPPSVPPKPQTDLPYPLTEEDKSPPYPLSPTDVISTADAAKKHDESDLPA